MNVEEIRKDFPILNQQVNGRPLAYLDNAATTQKPQAVIDAVSHFYEATNAAVHRAIHTLGESATEAYEGARQKAARFIGARSERSVVFVKNSSEGINVVAYAWGLQHLRAGDEIVVTAMEHHSNLIPWQQIARRQGARLRVAPLTLDGELDRTEFEKLLTDRTRLVALTQVSNVLGTVNPVRELVEAARSCGALVFVDAAQSVPHMPVDVESLGCDFLVYSGHKMCGPTGIGVLYGREERLEEMDPFLFGGSMIQSVSFESSTWKEIPWRFEAGTPNVAGAVGLGAAIDYLDAVGIEAIRDHEEALASYCLKRLADVEGVRVYGPRSGGRAGLVSFNVDGVHPHDVAHMLDQEGVAVRAGHHCAQPLMRLLDVAATARASFYLYNTEAEVDTLIDAIEKTKEFFRDVSG